MKFGSSSVVRATSEPASVPIAAASAQPNWSVRPMRMPSSWLDSRLDDTARNGRPIFVLFSSSVTRKTATSTVIHVNRSAYSISAPRSENVLLRPGNSDGMARAVERPDDAGDGVEDQEQRQRHDDDGEVVGRVERPDQHPLDAGGDDRRQHHRDQHRDRARDVEGVGDGVGDERADHRHLALGEVDDAGRLEDQDEGDRHGRVDEAVARAVEDALEEQLRAAVVDRPQAEADEEDQADHEPQLPVVARPWRGLACPGRRCGSGS